MIDLIFAAFVSDTFVFVLRVIQFLLLIIGLVCVTVLCLIGADFVISEYREARKRRIYWRQVTPIKRDTFREDWKDLRARLREEKASAARAEGLFYDDPNFTSGFSATGDLVNRLNLAESDDSRDYFVKMEPFRNGV